MLQVLHNATQLILEEKQLTQQLYNTVHELHELYASTNGISAYQQTDTDIQLAGGLAISAAKAAHCLLEPQRTAVFVRGIVKAIQQLKAQHPGEIIHILYAGCGPYATLLTPVTTLFTPDEVQFHLLDINPDSLKAAEQLYCQLGLKAYLSELILADAATYRISNAQPPHLIISETMLNGLRKEPQVAIMENLLPQLSNTGIFIPEQISITAQLLDKRLETESFFVAGQVPERINLGHIYSIGMYAGSVHPPVELTIPEDIKHHTSFALLTSVTVFEDEKIGDYECSLTQPLFLFDAKQHRGQKVTLSYQKGSQPGFTCVFAK